MHYDENGYTGYLTSVEGPLPGTSDTTRFTYDGFGRVRTITSTDGYTLTYDYDAADRVTRTTYPDTTYEQFAYNRLDRSVSRDRLGRQTFYEYSNLRQLTKIEDPLNRITRLGWCHCGALRTLIDPLGRATTWHYDVQGRMIDKTYADSSKIGYIYEDTPAASSGTLMRKASSRNTSIILMTPSGSSATQTPPFQPHRSATPTIPSTTVWPRWWTGQGPRRTLATPSRRHPRSVPEGLHPSMVHCPMTR